MSYTPLRDVADKINNLEDFQGNNISGTNYHGHCHVDRGLGDEAPPEGATYVVFSYYTPVAWICPDGTRHIVSKHFSSSTSRHVSCIPWPEAQERACDEYLAAKRVVDAENRRRRNERRRQDRAERKLQEEVARLDRLAEQQAIESLKRVLVKLSPTDAAKERENSHVLS